MTHLSPTMWPQFLLTSGLAAETQKWAGSLAFDHILVSRDSHVI
ncbi:hypothetical protein [Mesorhizobium sp. L2C084A000]|nr:hypothetical protein [Mesorhizobium sp. L2C084A000]ESZ24246.1 hypothetical protein X734_23325 [Mesorhizobium sp. L2C084A000]